MVVRELSGSSEWLLGSSEWLLGSSKVVVSSSVKQWITN